MGCEECGFYWDHPDEDKPCPICEANQLRCLVRELEEAQRWRKWPEEKPKAFGEYQCITVVKSGSFKLHIEWGPGADVGGAAWVAKVEPTWWRPIGELPKPEAGVVG